MASSTIANSNLIGGLTSISTFPQTSIQHYLNGDFNNNNNNKIKTHLEPHPS